MATLGNVNVDGLDLSAGMRNDLSSGMSVTDFNSKYAGGGFRPIATSRQVAAAATAAPAAAAPPSNEAAWNKQMTDFAAQQKAEFEALLGRQNAKQDGLFADYKTQLNGQEKLPDLYTRLSNEAGIPEATAQLQTYKDQIYRTKDLLDRLDEDVTSRTQGTMTTESMRRRIIASEGEDLNNQLGRLGTGMAPTVDLLTGAQGMVGTMMPLYMQQEDRELQPLMLEISSISDRFAREMTGFTQNRENQLTALMDNITRGRQLADRDWDLAQKLAAEEREFQRQKSLAAQQASAQYLPQQWSAPQQTYSQPVRQLPKLNLMQPSAGTLSLQSAPNPQSNVWGATALQGGGNMILQGGSGIRLQ